MDNLDTALAPRILYLVPDHAVVGIALLQDDVDAGEEARDEGLKVQEVDAYWLQRRIARALGPAVDAPRSQALAEQVGEGGTRKTRETV